jgi:hypothetical protein
MKFDSMAPAAQSHTLTGVGSVLGRLIPVRDMVSDDVLGCAAAFTRIAGATEDGCLPSSILGARPGAILENGYPALPHAVSLASNLVRFATFPTFRDSPSCISRVMKPLTAGPTASEPGCDMFGSLGTAQFLSHPGDTVRIVNLPFVAVADRLAVGATALDRAAGTIQHGSTGGHPLDSSAVGASKRSHGDNITNIVPIGK